jgi:lipoprotein LprG
MQRRLSALVLVAALAAAGSGCSDDEKKPGGGSGGTPEEVIASAKTLLDETSGVEVSLSTGELPGGITAIKKATGVGTHPSAFAGDLDLNYTGLPTSAEVIAVDGTTYIKNALLFPDWTEFDPAEFKTPDPATLMTPDDGFSALLGATTSLEEDDRSRCSKSNTDEATGYTGTVTGDDMAGLIPGSEGDFEVVYKVNDNGELCSAELTGAFYGESNGDLTYTLTLDEYGTEKEITAP